MVVLGGLNFLMREVSLNDKLYYTLTESHPSAGVRHTLVFASQRENFIDNLLVRVHLIIEMILVDRPCATGV